MHRGGVRVQQLKPENSFPIERALDLSLETHSSSQLSCKVPDLKYLLPEVSVSWNLYLTGTCKIRGSQPYFSRACQDSIGIKGLQGLIAEEGWEHVLSGKHSWDGSGEFSFYF